MIDTLALLWGEDLALSMATTFGPMRMSQLTLRYFPGISHWVQQDAPNEANAMIQSFLAGEPVRITSPSDSHDLLGHR